MANTLLIEKQSGGYFKFTLNGDTANAVENTRNDLLSVGNQLHFKTSEGANLIKKQEIYPADVTLIATGTFTFTTVDQVFTKLIEVGYFDWINGGTGGGATRFDQLDDTFDYVGNDGKAVIVDEAQLKLIPVVFHNVENFTQLSDTPDALVANKMVVVNSAGTALEFKDLPAEPETFINSLGSFHYEDLTTATTPISVPANTQTQLTNDTLGAYTNISNAPYGVAKVWDEDLNQFDFTSLSLGDTCVMRIQLQVTTTTANQKIHCDAKFGIGSAGEFELVIDNAQVKTAGVFDYVGVLPFDIAYTTTRDYPAKLYVTSDASCTVKVIGWYIEIIRKSINVIDIITDEAPIDGVTYGRKDGIWTPVVASTAVETVTGVIVDNTDPQNPIINTPTKSQVGLGNVDDTSDLNKPISTATQSALDLKANLTDLDWDNVGSDIQNNNAGSVIHKGAGNTSATKNTSFLSNNNTEIAVLYNNGRFETLNNILTNGFLYADQIQGLTNNFKVQSYSGAAVGTLYETAYMKQYASNYVRFDIADTIGGFDYVERVRLTKDGLGIGTTTPSERLHIVGNARITGSIKDSSNSAGTSGQILSSTGTGTQWITSSGGGATNLGYTPSATNGIVTSDTGTDATVPLADATNAGLLKPADFTQLSTLASDLSGKALDSAVLHKTGNEISTGTKTFEAVAITGKTVNDILLGDGTTKKINQFKTWVKMAGVYALQSTTAAQKIFGNGNPITNGAVVLKANTQYAFKLRVYLNGLVSATANYISIGFLGTANGGYQGIAVGSKSTANTTSTAFETYIAGSIGNLYQATNSSGSQQDVKVVFQGEISTGTTVNPTIIPAIAMSLSQAGLINYAYFEIEELANDTTNYNGNWS